MAIPLKKVSNPFWVYYINEAEASKFDNSRSLRVHRTGH